MTGAIYLALGSNLGERDQNLACALDMLEARGISIVKRSSIYETAPRDVLDQPWFLNVVVEVATDLHPAALLGVLQDVERKLGRDRTHAIRFGPRLIDIDILLYGNASIATAELQVPHPRLTERRFVLEPLVEIAAELRDPVSGKLFRDFLSEVADQPVRRLNP
jgi:2-amino-4-hydroxy-6-hydroxymethyldihydropteridine diphosphokinase